MNKLNEQNILEEKRDRLLSKLNKIILWCVKGLAMVMTFVILWAFIDVIYHVYSELHKSIDTVFSVDALFSIIGAILFFLIAIEIYLNIVFFLKKDVINVALVLATALTAIARKVIILDYTVTSEGHMFAIAALIIALGVAFWLVTRQLVSEK